MLHFTGSTEYVTRLEDESEIVRKYILPREKVVGFGCHRKSNDAPIGVIQIATAHKVYVFHIAAYRERMNIDNDKHEDNDSDDDDGDEEAKQERARKLQTRKRKYYDALGSDEMFHSTTTATGQTTNSLISMHLRYLLESNEYVKVGIDIDADFMRLSRDLDVQCDEKSILDLRQLHLHQHHAPPSAPLQLSWLCQQVLGGDIDRSSDVSKSEWTQYPLSEEQIRFASETAYFALKLYCVMQQEQQPPQQQQTLVAMDDEHSLSAYVQTMATKMKKAAATECLGHTMLSTHCKCSWSDLIFCTRVYQTGALSVGALSLRKREVYQCLHDFGLDCDAIVDFRAYALTRSQIETYFADAIGAGVEYNWKAVHDAVFCIASTSAQQPLLYCVHWIVLQSKTIECVEQELANVLNKYHKLKDAFVESVTHHSNVNVTRLQQHFESVWMLIRLKSIREKLLQYFENGKEEMQTALIRYSLIRMIVFHFKRVAWMKLVAHIQSTHKSKPVP